MAFSSSRPRRTVAPPISYRDGSSDDETTDAPLPRSSRRLARSDRRREPSETGVDAFPGIPARAADRRQTNPSAGRTIRQTRRAKNVKYYEVVDEDSDEVEAEVTSRPTAPLKASANPRKRKLSTQPVPTKAFFGSFKRRKPNQDRSHSLSKTSPAARSEIKFGITPPWQTLPYQILLSILQYASHPLYRDASHEAPSIAWLVSASTLCKSFHDAAIAALVYSPPLYPSTRAHDLQRLLDSPEETLSTTYRNKIKRLDVEVRSLLIKKSGIDLVKLIRQTPLLSSLHLYHNHDRVGAVAWAQPFAATGRSWSYPTELFDALDDHQIRLKEWGWNGRFPDTMPVLDEMKMRHGRACLKNITSLSLINLAETGKAKSNVEGLAEAKLTSALNALPELQALTMKSCSIINDKVLAYMPPKLRSLSISNCKNFNSTYLQLYLVEHGHQLEELDLRGNQALDLGFADSLDSLCPHLRVFTIDFTYSDPSAFHDIDPHFEAVFPDGNMPTWPRALQTVHVENLRNLDAKDAESFLRSLVAVALEMKVLRKLSIRILLQDDSWRERARLRQFWIPKLEDVYLRKAAAPRPSLPQTVRRTEVSIAGAISSSSNGHPTSSSSVTGDNSTSASPNKRKSARIAKRELRDLLNDTLAASSLPTNRMRAATKFGDGDEKEAVLPHQGMCSEVTLHIDGQRPADEQFKEADFLDDEISGDEEWNGKDVEAMTRGYAW